MNQSITLLLRLAERDNGRLGERYAALAAALRRHEQVIQRYERQALRIGTLETELIDDKIASRADGLLQEWRLDRETIAILEAHVEGVLRQNRLGTMLEQELKALEEELAERKLTQQAKSVLQSAYRMSEEEAHRHLRTVSRKTRRPLTEVARELLRSGASPAS